MTRGFKKTFIAPPLYEVHNEFFDKAFRLGFAPKQNRKLSNC